MLPLAFRLTGIRASAAPTRIEPTAKPIITIENPPAPRWSELRTSVGTPAIQQPVVIVIAIANTTTPAVSAR